LGVGFFVRYIFVYIGSDDELNFFARLADIFRKKNYEFIFFSNKISLIIKLQIRSYTSHLIKKYCLLEKIPDLSKCFELRIGFITSEEADILYSSVYGELRSVSMKYLPEYIFIWNGLSVQTVASSDFARKEGIKTRYFELANLPGKMFVNPSGVNAQSSLYRNINILNKYVVEEPEYLNWMKAYESSLAENIVSKKRYINNYLFLLDLLGFYFFKIPKSGETNLVNKYRYSLPFKMNIKYDEVDLSKKRYVFLPLQVNHDTQLIFNSEIGNLEAIGIAYKRAVEEGADLILKIHPAEFDKNFIRAVVDLRNKLQFLLVNYCVSELIKNALIIITINSTVGLQGKIFNKNVEFIGRSFYPLLDEQLLRNYILRYLINAEYLSERKIEKKITDQIINVE
jgi:capsular polysaccharide export protein